MTSPDDRDPPPGQVPRDVAAGGFWDLMRMQPLPPASDGQPGRLMLRVGQGHLRSLGLMHGGVAAAMLDSVMGRAAFETSPPGHHVVTVQLNVHFIRTAREGDTLTAEAVIQHAGRRTSVVSGEIRTDSGALIATATGTFMHLPAPPADPPIRDGPEA